MTCRELAEFVGAYLSGELEPAARVEFDRHLAECEACVSYLDSYRSTVDAGKAAFADEPVPAVPEELVRAILAAKRAQG
jgi:anti-sigma factor RsiW